MGAEPLPVLSAAAVPEQPAGRPWLVEHLWSDLAVGVIGGAPKCCKSWLALDLAVAVASGVPALGRFAVTARGPVLLYGAEDALADQRDRIAGIAKARGLRLADLAIGLIDVPSLRLDTARDRDRLTATVVHHGPRLLILDPLVRLHRVDENSATDVSAVLGELRALQRQHHVAILLVHHARKNAAGRGQEGQALRGSGDLHAWGDSNLYLRRRDRLLALTVEHRSAPAPAPFTIELATDPAPHLRVVDDPAPQATQTNLNQAILAALSEAGGPLGRETLRDRLRVRNGTLGEVLAGLRAAGLVERCERGFRLTPRPLQPIPVPAL